MTEIERRSLKVLLEQQKRVCERKAAARRASDARHGLSYSERLKATAKRDIEREVRSLEVGLVTSLGDFGPENLQIDIERVEPGGFVAYYGETEKRFAEAGELVAFLHSFIDRGEWSPVDFPLYEELV